MAPNHHLDATLHSPITLLTLSQCRAISFRNRSAALSINCASHTYNIYALADPGRGLKFFFFFWTRKNEILTTTTKIAVKKVILFLLIGRIFRHNKTIALVVRGWYTYTVGLLTTWDLTIHLPDLRSSTGLWPFTPYIVDHLNFFDSWLAFRTISMV